MNNGSNFGLQFQAESSAELVQKYIVMVGNARASKRRKECISTQEPKKSSTLNQGKNQQPIGSIQKQSIGHSQTIGIDGGSIQNLDQRKQSLAIGGVSIQETGSMLVQSKKQYQRKQSLNNRAATRNIETTQVSHQMDLAKSITVVQSEPPKKINGQSKEFCHNNLKRQLRSTVANPRQGTMEEEQASKKKKYITKCPAMTLDEYINNNKHQHEVEETADESREENSQEPGVEGDINYESEEVEEINENTSKGAVSKRRRGRGKTLLTNIHTRSPDYKQEITLNEEGQPIGPNERIVSQFSSFLGTVARRSDLCPLTYTNWKAVPEKDKNIWSYVNERYIVPEKGKKAVYAIINDAWRRYKCSIKKNHFSKYKNLRERLKNRPKGISEEHFRKLMEYWRLEAVREISLKNAQNTAQQKRRHRAGPISFARIRERMRAREEDRDPPHAEMFIGTLQSEKGKELDQETSDAVIKFQNMMVSSGQSSSEAFRNILGKEKPKRVHYHGKTATATTLLKRNEEIAEIKRAHASEMKQLKGDHASEVKQLKDQVQGMGEKFQLFIKTMLNQNNSGQNMEALAALLSTPSDANSALRSSTPALDKHELMASKESPPFNCEVLGKAKWDSISTKMLLAICMDGIRKSGKSGIAFRNEKWEEIREEFHKRANKNYTEKQLKNKLDNLRVDWTTWKQLMGKETSLRYNHQTGTIEADAAWWDAKIRENTKYAKFRYKGLEFCDQLEFIFGETVVTNETQWTPAVGVPTESSGKNSASDVPHEIIESDDDCFNMDDEDSPMESTQSSGKKRKAPQDMSGESTKGKRKVRTTMSMRKTSEQLVQATGCQNEVGKNEVAATSVGKNEVAATSHVYGEYSIQDCVKVLKSAKEKGLLNGREFSYALEMLRDDQTRVLLMSLKDSMDALVEWILYKYVSEGKL